MEEKALITKENISIFKRIKLFFKKLFYKEIKKENTVVSEVKKEYTKSNVLEELKSKQKSLELQQKYESGYVLEKDLTDVQKEELIALYKIQIETLKERKSKNAKVLEDYKNKIMIIRSKEKIQ